MPAAELQPLAKTGEIAALAANVALNLRRLNDTIASLGRVEQAKVEITGSVTIDTGIPIVKNVVACLEEAPVAGACFVVAALNPLNQREVIVTVYSDAFAVSVIPINVNIVIIGDEPPNRPTRS